MYFTPALLSALSLSAVTAMPINVARSNELGQFNKLMARSDNALALMRNGNSLPFARSPAQLQATVGQIRALVARSDADATGGLSGILELMGCLLNTLLGESTDSSCPAGLEGSTGADTTGNARVAMASMLSNLSDALSTSSKKMAATNSKRQDTTDVSSSASTNDVLALLSKLEQIIQNVMNDLMNLGLKNPASNSTSDDGTDGDRDETGGDDTGSDDEPSGDEDQGDDGSDGEETPSSDAPSSTSPLPNQATAATTSSSAAVPPSTATSVGGFGKNCPAPGTPNDGMYRPGCPGYGRRDLASRSAAAANKKRALDASTLKDLLPALSTIIEAMPDLISAAGGNITDATNSTSSVAGQGNSTVVANATALAQSQSFKKVVTQIHQLVSAVSSNSTSTSSAASSSETGRSHKASAASQAVSEINASGTGAQTPKESVNAASISHGSREAQAIVSKRSDGAKVNMDLVNDLFAEILSGKQHCKRRLPSDY